MGVVPILRGVLLVTRCDGDSSLPLFGSVVYLVEGDYVVGTVTGYVLCQYLRDSCGEGSFAVVYVAYGAYVQMRLVPLISSF